MHLRTHLMLRWAGHALCLFVCTHTHTLDATLHSSSVRLRTHTHIHTWCFTVYWVETIRHVLCIYVCSSAHTLDATLDMSSTRLPARLMIYAIDTSDVCSFAHTIDATLDTSSVHLRTHLTLRWSRFCSFARALDVLLLDTFSVRLAGTVADMHVCFPWMLLRDHWSYKQTKKTCIENSIANRYRYI